MDNWLGEHYYDCTIFLEHPGVVDNIWKKSYLNGVAKLSSLHLCAQCCCGWKKDRLQSSCPTCVISCRDWCGCSSQRWLEPGWMQTHRASWCTLHGEGYCTCRGCNMSKDTKVDKCQTYILKFPDTFMRVPSRMKISPQAGLAHHLHWTPVATPYHTNCTYSTLSKAGSGPMDRGGFQRWCGSDHCHQLVLPSL